MHIWVGFAVLALVFWGITGVTQKLSTNSSRASDRSCGFAGRWSPSPPECCSSPDLTEAWGRWLCSARLQAAS